MLKLLPTMDREATGILARELTDAFSGAGPITLSGSEVEQIGQTGLQLLLSARRTAIANDITLRLTSPSSALVAAVELAGLDSVLTFEAGSEAHHAA